MKAIINGKRYSTETATRVVVWSNGYYENDFHHVEETLYRTPKGAYFLHWAGGPYPSTASRSGQMAAGVTLVLGCSQAGRSPSG